MRFLHSGSMGDIIYSLPSIASMCSSATLYLKPDVYDPIPPFAGIRQPYRMTRDEALSLIPLLSAQPYIASVALYDGETFDVNLDRFRLQAGDICQCYGFNPVLDKPWLTVEPSSRFKDYVFVNRTQRYQNEDISYQFLCRPDVCFLGYQDEYRAFTKANVRISLCVTATDSYELASWLAGCKGFIGNQSFCFAIAEALKIKRVLEVYPEADNVSVHGPNGVDAFNHKIFEAHCLELFK